MNRMKTVALACLLTCGFASTPVNIKCNRIFTASSDNTAKIWDLDGNCLATFQHAEGLRSAAFNPAGNRVVTAAEDKTAKLWNLDGNCLMTFRGHKCFVDSAIFNPGGSRILTSSAVFASPALVDRSAKICDLDGNCLATFQHSNSVHSAVFNLTGDRILTSSADKTAKLWDLNGNCLVTLRGHIEGVRSAIFNPVGDRIVTASDDGTAKLWDLQGNCLVTFRGHACRHCWDGRFLGTINSVVFDSASDRIVTASFDKTAKLWDLDGNCLATFQHSDQVVRAVFNPREDRILTASLDGTAKLWDLNGNCLVTFQGHGGGVQSAAFNPTGDRILTASYDGKAKLWDLDGNCLVTFQGHTSYVLSAVFGPLPQPSQAQQVDPQPVQEEPSEADASHLCVAQVEEDTGGPAVSYACERDRHSCRYHRPEDEVPSAAASASEVEEGIAHLALPATLSRRQLGLMKYALLGAARAGDYATVQDCIRSEELFETRDFDGLTALHLAARYGHVNIVRLLLKHGVSVDMPAINLVETNRGSRGTALHYAVSGGHYEVAMALLGHGASPQAPDREGNTPLHIAAKQQIDATFDIVNALLIQGASTTKKNNREQTPLNVAIEVKNELVIDLLLDWQSRAAHSEPGPERREEQEVQCCICLEPLVDNLVAGNTADSDEPCGHRIHEACSRNLYRCPLCNKDLNRRRPWMRLY